MGKAGNITGGLYLVLDPALDQAVLLKKVKLALEGGAEVLQIWNHWPEGIGPVDKKDLIDSIVSVADEYNVPVMINEEWELLKTTKLDGVHFDRIPQDYEHIQSAVGREFLAGITCSNDISVIEWAELNQLDYISFCSMFPSQSVDSCDIVMPVTVKKAREITQIPLFLSGGITAENIESLNELEFDGIAVISGIMNAESPEKSASGYKKTLNKMRNKNEK